MKIRIKDNSIRLRLTKSEVDQLVREGVVACETRFNEQQIFVYRLVSINISEPTAHFEGGVIELRFPNERCQRWAHSDEVSLQARADELTLLVEKDFTCLSARPEEQNGDYYPHPLQNS